MRLKRFFYGTVLCLFLFSIVLVEDAAAIDPGDVVGLWLFEEGEGTIVHDRSGNDNHGTFNGSINWTTGAFGSALDCGDTGHVLIQDSGSLDLEGAWTLSLWVNINPPMARWQTILNKRFDVATNYVIRLNDGGSWEVMINNGGWVRVMKCASAATQPP